MSAASFAIGQDDRGFARGLARAFAGAIIFSLPLLMTMEMWWLGFHMDSWRLALFLALFFPALVLLSWHAGFEPTFSWRDDVVDALVAYAVGFVWAALILSVMGMLDFSDMSAREVVGKLSLQAVPGSIGALLAQTLLGLHKADESGRHPATRYSSELFVMGVGALFLGFHLAPTEEVQLIAYRMSETQSLLLMLLTLALMHAFVYTMAFRGQHEVPHATSSWSLFLRFTVVGYVLALALAAYVLWSFGSLEDQSPLNALKCMVVLGFPAGIGAAAARLIL
jgi:putative integral membrane protein (TIGR02587 family)